MNGRFEILHAIVGKSPVVIERRISGVDIDRLAEQTYGCLPFFLLYRHSAEQVVQIHIDGILLQQCQIDVFGLVNAAGLVEKNGRVQRQLIFGRQGAQNIFRHALRAYSRQFSVTQSTLTSDGFGSP